MQGITDENRVIKLALWLTEHPKVQRKLCDNEYEVTPDEFIEIMEMLEENGFYEMILILLIKNLYNATLEQAMSRTFMEKMAKEWERIGTKKMCKDMKDKIREEIKLKEARGSKF